MPHVKLTPEVEQTLRESRIEGNVLFLPARQLDRPLYEAVNKAIEAAGGTWNRSRRGHVFPIHCNAAEKLGLALKTGQVIDEKKLYQFYPTPAALAASVVAQASVKDRSVLEPSAGHGALAMECRSQGARAVTRVEVTQENCRVLKSKGLATLHADFLTIQPSGDFDRVVMNPPFANHQDLKHVGHAFGFLKPGGGRLMAIMQGNRTKDEIHACIEESYSTRANQSIILDLDIKITEAHHQSFHESGTDVRTIIVEIE